MRTHVRSAVGNARQFPEWAVVLGVSGIIITVFGLGLWGLIRPKYTPPPQTPGVAQETFVGPHGPVTLHDWRDGRRWLSWYQANKDWVGEGLWADKPWREHVSCAGFERVIVCINPSADAKGTYWELAGINLGTIAMERAGLRPDASAQPAEVVSAYLMDLRLEGGVDTWYRFGAPQSPAFELDGVMVQFFQRVQWVWPVGSTDPESVRLAPLGQRATEKGW